MARGFIFGVSCNKDEAMAFEASDVYDLAGPEFDWVSDENNPDAVRELADRFRQLPGVTVLVETDDEDGEPIFVITFTDEAKRAYFQARLVELKACVYNLTLDEFALSDPYELRWLVNNTYADAVFCDFFMTMDSFIREAVVGEPYYLKYAYLMH